MFWELQTPKMQFCSTENYEPVSTTMSACIVFTAVRTCWILRELEGQHRPLVTTYLLLTNTHQHCTLYFFPLKIDIFDAKSLKAYPPVV